MYSISFIILALLFSISHQWCQKFKSKQNDDIRAVSFSIDNFYVAVAVKDTHVRIYSALNYVLVKTYTAGGTTPRIVRFSRGGRYLGIGYDNANVKILNSFEPFDQNITINANHGSTRDLDFTTNDTHLATCGTDTILKIWTIVHGVAPWSMASKSPGAGSATSCRFSPSNQAVAIATFSSIYAYSMTGLTFLGKNPSNRQYNQIVFSQNQTFIYASTQNQEDIYRYNYSVNPFTQLTIYQNGDDLDTIDLSQNGKYIISGSEAGQLFIFNQTSHNHSLIYMMQLTDVILDAKFSKDSRSFALGLENNNLFYIFSDRCNIDCQTGLFFDYTSKKCQQCAAYIPKCSICYNLTYCYQCEVGFWLNKTTRRCEFCSTQMQGCAVCQVYNQCKFCAPSYVYMSGSKKCQKCARHMTGCNDCNSTSFCLSCISDYYLDVNNTNKCKTCSSSTTPTMSVCNKCINSTFCLECGPGFFASTTGLCIKCDPICIYCSGTATNCTQCTLGYYANPISSYTCQPCTYGCLKCNSTNTCFDCMDQMYEKSDGTCAFCLFPCASCYNLTFCITCIQGYFLNSSDSKCYRCQNRCNTCNSTSFCVSCFQGYYLFNNSCQNCQKLTSYCTQCSATNCTKCIQGFYYQNSSNTCKKCISTMYKCLRCKSTTNCEQCSLGYYLHPTNTGNTSCITCPYQCQTCVSATNCTKCFSGFYFQSTNWTCTSCQTQNCVQCVNKTYCTYCKIGYYLQSSSNKCLSCSLQGCYQCTQVTSVQKCQRCIPGYWLDSSTKTCKQCSSINCSVCDPNNGTLCLSCAIGYYLNTGSKTCLRCNVNCTQCTGSASNCTSCNYGLYYFNNTCTSCTSKFTQSCLSCTYTNCLICKYGYYLVNTTANTPPAICKSCSVISLHCIQCNNVSCTKCSFGSYLDTVATPNKCLQCVSNIQGCRHCSSNTTCTVCQEGYFLNSSKCIKCMLGCQKCSSLNACEQCNTRFLLQTVNNTCILCDKYKDGCQICYKENKDYCNQCQNGYYLNIVNSTFSECLYCDKAIAGCKYCKSTTQCLKCIPGYHLDSTLVSGSILCTKCASTIQGCQICINDSSIANIKCVDCQNGYYLSTNTSYCYLCEVKITGCIYCSNDGTICTLCNTGYFLNSTIGKCSLCSTIQSGCQMCEQFNDTSINCLKQKGGFYLSIVSTNYTQAQPCSSVNCQICLFSNSSKCVTCNSGYYLITSNSSCAPCSTPIQGCLACGNSSQCYLCNTGYYLTNSTKKCDLCNVKFTNCLICTQTECLKCQSLYLIQNTTKLCQTCGQSFYGCKYCNQTTCFSCANNFYKLNNSCVSCENITGCLACNSYGSCLDCKQNYLLDNSTSQCVLCNTFIPECFVCTSSTVCAVCMSGYLLDSSGICKKVTSGGGGGSSNQKLQFKLSTQYVDASLLRHQLYSINYQYAKIDVSTNLTQFQMFIVYTLNGVVIKQPLTVISLEWSSFNHQVLIIYTNNPIKVTHNSMDIYRRLLIDQSSQGSISLGGANVQLQISQDMTKALLPDAKIVGDTQIKYDLDNSQFYASYIQKNNMQIWYFIAFGYIVIIVLVINYFIKSFYTYQNQKSDHGQMILHYLSLASPCLILYPTSIEMLSFCYGFMLLNFPWLNRKFGQILGNSFDVSPNSTKILYMNLNIGSTYALALGILVFLAIAGYFVIVMKRQKAKQKQTVNSIFFNYLYNFFSFGALFSATLAIQGCFMNPINQLLSFNQAQNSVCYIIGLLLFFLIGVDLVHSMYSQTTRYFYKLRNFLKTVLLAMAHLNSTYFFAVMVILDLLFVAGQYFIVKKQDKNFYTKIWISKNIMLELSIILLTFFPNKLLSIIFAMVLALTCVLLQIYQHYKQRQSLQMNSMGKRTQNNSRYSHANNRSINNTLVSFNNQKTQFNGTKASYSNAWNLDFENLQKGSNIPYNSKGTLASKLSPPPISSKKMTSRSKEPQRQSNFQRKFQTIDVEFQPRRRRQRSKKLTARSNTLSTFEAAKKNRYDENILHVRNTNVFDENHEVQRISDF